MTTNLYIGYPQIGGETAATATHSDTADTGWPIKNLLGGGRQDRFRASTAATGDHRLKIVGTATAANFIFIADAKCLQKSGVTTLTVKGHSSDSYAAATTILTDASFSTATLYGAGSEDYYSTFSISSAWAYWYVNLNAASIDTKAPHSKCFLGTGLDLGRDPDSISSQLVLPGSFARRPRWQFNLSWSAIAYAAAKTFQTICIQRESAPIVLYTATNHGPLNGIRCLLCRITDATWPVRFQQKNDITLSVEELL